MYPIEAIRELAEMLSYRPESGELKRLFDLTHNTELTKEEIKCEFASDDKFRKAFKKLKDKYLEEVLTHSFSESKEYTRKQQAVYRKYAQAKLLIKAEKKKSGIPTGKEVLSAAKKLGILGLVLDMSNELMNHYAVVVPNRRKFNTYQKTAADYAQGLKETTEAKVAYSRLAIELNLGVKPTRAREDLERLREMAKSNSHYRFRFYYYCLRNLYRRSRGDNEGVVHTCEDAIEYFETCTVEMPYVVKWSFHFYLIPILIAQGRFEQARKRIIMSKVLPKKGGYNYHLSLLLQATLGICSGEIEAATDALHEAGKRWYFESESVVNHWLSVQKAIADVEGGMNYKDVGGSLLGELFGVSDV